MLLERTDVTLKLVENLLGATRDEGDTATLKHLIELSGGWNDQLAKTALENPYIQPELALDAWNGHGGPLTLVSSCCHPHLLEKALGEEPGEVAWKILENSTLKDEVGARYLGGLNGSTLTKDNEGVLAWFKADDLRPLMKVEADRLLGEMPMEIPASGELVGGESWANWIEKNPSNAAQMAKVCSHETLGELLSGILYIDDEMPEDELLPIMEAISERCHEETWEGPEPLEEIWASAIGETMARKMVKPWLQAGCEQSHLYLWALQNPENTTTLLNYHDPKWQNEAALTTIQDLKKESLRCGPRELRVVATLWPEVINGLTVTKLEMLVMGMRARAVRREDKESNWYKSDRELITLILGRLNELLGNEHQARISLGLMETWKGTIGELGETVRDTHPTP